MLEDGKKWYLSKTIILLIVPLIYTAFGIGETVTQAYMTDIATRAYELVEQLFYLASEIAAIYTRVIATQKISRRTS